MSFQHQLLIKNSGFLIPEPLLKRTTQLFTSCWGMALVNEGVIDVRRENSPPNFDELAEMQNTLKDEDFILFFGQGGTKFHDDDVQPFDIITVKAADGIEDVKLVMFADGDFTAHFKEGTTHPNEFLFTKAYLIPKLNRALGHVNGDVAELVKEIVDPASYMEYAGHFGERGNLVFMAAQPKDQINLIKKPGIADDPTCIVGDWGYASKAMDMNVKVLPEGGTAMTETKPVTNARPASKLGGKPPVASVPAVPNKTDTKTGTVLQNTVTEPDKSATTASQHTSSEVWMKPPEKLKADGELKSWFGAYAVKPVKQIDIKARPAVLIKPDKVSQCKERGGIVVQMGNKTATAAPAAPVPPQFSPVMSAKELEDLSTWKQTLDANALRIVDPQDIPGIEDEHPTFTDLNKLESLDYLHGLSEEAIYDLTRTAPKAAMLLIVELRAARAMLTETEEIVPDAPAKATGTDSRATVMSFGGKK